MCKWTSIHLDKKTKNSVISPASFVENEIRVQNVLSVGPLDLVKVDVVGGSRSYLHMMGAWRQLMARLWKLNPLIGSDGGSSTREIENLLLK